MTPTNRHILNLRKIVLAACFLALALSGAQAQPPPKTPAKDKVWTTVGSAGTVDETDAGKVFFNGSVVQMGQPFAGGIDLGDKILSNSVDPKVLNKSNQKVLSKSAGQKLGLAPVRSAIIRYNITPVEGLFAFDGFRSGMGLTLRYLASDSRSRVVAKLNEVDLASGAETTRVTFDSSDPRFQVSNAYQVQSVVICSGSGPFMFNFSDKAPGKAYYIEATLTAAVDTPAAGSAAGIQIIKVANVLCIT